MEFWNTNTQFCRTVGEYLKKRNIIIEEIAFPKNPQIKGYRIKLFAPFVTTIDMFGHEYAEVCRDAIKVFLTFMGDKATFKHKWRDLWYNWRINWDTNTS